jgi:hypothetical protein
MIANAGISGLPFQIINCCIYNVSFLHQLPPDFGNCGGNLTFRTLGVMGEHNRSESDWHISLLLCYGPSVIKQGL